MTTRQRRLYLTTDEGKTCEIVSVPARCCRQQSPQRMSRSANLRACVSSRFAGRGARCEQPRIQAAAWHPGSGASCRCGVPHDDARQQKYS